MGDGSDNDDINATELIDVVPEMGMPQRQNVLSAKEREGVVTAAFRTVPQGLAGTYFHLDQALDLVIDHNVTHYLYPVFAYDNLREKDWVMAPSWEGSLVKEDFTSRVSLAQHATTAAIEIFCQPLSADHSSRSERKIAWPSKAKLPARNIFSLYDVCKTHGNICSPMISLNIFLTKMLLSNTRPSVYIPTDRRIATDLLSRHQAGEYPAGYWRMVE